MDKKIIFGRSIKDVLFAIGPTTLFMIVALIAAYFYVDPAPPNHLVITTGDGEGDYQFYADEYKKILAEDGVTLEIRASKGPLENLKRLENDDANVDVGFMQDGIGSPEEQPDLVSLGSVYYEPLWVFYRGSKELTRLSEIEGKRIAIGRTEGGTRILALKLLKASGVTLDNSKMVNVGWDEAVDALEKGGVDAAFFIAAPDDARIDRLMHDSGLRLMSLDQAEAVTRQIPFLHHVVLPHGSIDLKQNLPTNDVHLVSPTATLLARDDLHPALSYLLLKAAARVHGPPGMLERKGEFPSDKDNQFPLSPDARAYYKNGTPFWQRFLPFWLAALVDRFILLAIPIIALLLPLIRLVPQLYRWRIRSRIYQRYGELKYLETQIRDESGRDSHARYLAKLDAIEDRVNNMKVPLEFSEHIYSLRGHIDFVRGRLAKALASRGSMGEERATQSPS